MWIRRKSEQAKEKSQCHSAEATGFTNATIAILKRFYFPCIIIEGRPSLETSS
jgi:hypothetical protein